MKLKTLAEMYNYTCYVCHQKFLLDELSRDHFNPSIKRNRDIRKNGRRRGGVGAGSNIRLACIVCNLSKANTPAYIK